MGLQMIVISASALALIGLVNREGVDDRRRLRRGDAAVDLSADAGDGARRGGERDGRAEYRRRPLGPGQRDHPLRRDLRVLITAALVVLLALADRPALALFLGGDSPALPIARHIQILATWSFLLFGVTLVLFGTVRANGAVIGPLIILFVGLVPVRLGFALGAYPWLGADALWLSFPVSSFANMVLAIAFYLHGGWRKARMGPPPDPARNASRRRRRRASRGGRLNPTG